MTVKKEVVKETEVVKKKVIDAKYLENKIQFYIVEKKKVAGLVDGYVDMHRKLSGAIEAAMAMLKEEFGIDYKLPEPKENKN